MIMIKYRMSGGKATKLNEEKEIVAGGGEKRQLKGDGSNKSE